MKYFLHDTDSFNDEKITELYMKFGFEGLGLFYTILEKMAKQEKPVKTDVLKHQLKIGKRLNKCWSFMEEIEIISSNNGETFNKQLLNFSEKYQIKKEKNRKRISEWRESQPDTKNVTCNEQVRNSPKVKRSKVKRSKEVKETPPDVNPSFLEIKNYGKEKGYNLPVQKIIDHYTNGGELKYWIDANNKKVIRWKSKISSVWLKDEYKTKQQSNQKTFDAIK